MWWEFLFWWQAMVEAVNAGGVSSNSIAIDMQ